MKKIILLLIFLVSFQKNNAQSKTEILILGTKHLGYIKDFKPDAVNEIIRRLDQFQFDAVAIENMPAQLLYDIQSRNDSAFADLLEGWAKERLEMAKSMQEYLNIDFFEAQQRLTTLLAEKVFDQNKRELLIKYFVASADLVSAVLQFNYTRSSTQVDTSTFYNSVISKLDELSRSHNEIFSLGLKVAKGKGLQKIEYIDDFQDEALLFKYFPNFIQDYTQNQDMFKKLSSKPVFKKVDSLASRGITNMNLSQLFVYLNSKEFQKLDFEAQWEIWLKTNFKSGTDRSRYALWEMRNLLITANIMKTAAFYPGKKILVIIGASHKSFLEKYLRQIPSIKIMSL